MAPRPPSRRSGARSQCVAHDDAGMRSPQGEGVRHSAFSPGLLPVLAVLPAVDAVRDNLARTSRSSGAPGALQRLLHSAAHFDFGLAAASRAGCAVDLAIEIASRCGLPLKIAAKVDPVDRNYFEAKIEPLLARPGVEFIGEIADPDK